MIIRDPNSGRGQNISVGGMAITKAIIQTISEYSNIDEGDAYSAVVSVTPTGAGDCFFYMINNDNRDIVVSSMKLYSASAESVQIKLGDIGTVGGTHAALIPVNRNAGSAKTADVTCESGVDITGLSGGSVVDDLVAGATMWRWEWFTGLILPKNKMLSLYAVTGAIAIKMTIGFHFKSLALEI
jgi:hypothetical protein